MEFSADKTLFKRPFWMSTFHNNYHLSSICYVDKNTRTIIWKRVIFECPDFYDMEGVNEQLIYRFKNGFWEISSVGTTHPDKKCLDTLIDLAGNDPNFPIMWKDDLFKDQIQMIKDELNYMDLPISVSRSLI